MKQERYKRIQTIFHEAIDLEGEERLAFLDRACAGDAELRREVERFLAHGDGEDDGFDRNIFEKIRAFHSSSRSSKRSSLVI